MKKLEGELAAKRDELRTEQQRVRAGGNLAAAAATAAEKPECGVSAEHEISSLDRQLREHSTQVDELAARRTHLLASIQLLNQPVPAPAPAHNTLPTEVPAQQNALPTKADLKLDIPSARKKAPYTLLHTYHHLIHL